MKRLLAAALVGGMLSFSVVTTTGAAVPAKKCAKLKTKKAQKKCAKAKAAEAAAPENTPEIMLDEFNAITPGMTYEQVAAIVGGPGKVQMQYTTPAFGDPSDSYYTPASTYTTYEFPAGAFDTVTVSFQDNVETSKFQMGLG